jgi:DNA replication protein DnaC
MLILDDFGTQNATPWAVEKLYQLLNYRYNRRLPTVITTNQSLGEMDPRLASRLSDRGLVHSLDFYVPDFRVEGHSRTFGSLDAYQGMTFGTFEDRQLSSLRRALEAAAAYAENPVNWLVLRGGFGVGKTHLAAAIANKVQRGGLSVLLVVVPDLLDYLRATFQPGSPVSYDQRFNEVRQAPFLVLDDLGMQSETEWAREKLFQILNYRYVAGTATVVTVSSEGWERLDERLRGRLDNGDRCVHLLLDCPPFRGREAEARAPRRSTRRRT